MDQFALVCTVVVSRASIPVPPPPCSLPEAVLPDGKVMRALPARGSLVLCAERNSWDWKPYPTYPTWVCRPRKASPRKLTQGLLWRVPGLTKCMGTVCFGDSVSRGSIPACLLRRPPRHAPVSLSGVFRRGNGMEAVEVGPSHPFGLLWPPC